MEDRTLAICDLLMGAAYADQTLHDKEQEAVETYLKGLLPDGEITTELKERMAGFDAKNFKLSSVVSEFAADSKSDRIKLLDIVAAIHAADDEHDMAEDEYLHEVANGLGLSEEDTKDHALDYEVETLKENLAKIRPSPPPIPNT